MKIKIMSLPLIVFVGLFFLGCESKPLKAESSSEVVSYNSNPTFTLNTIDNKAIDITVSKNTISSQQLQNKIVLVNFWAPWCEPCKKEMPSFVNLQNKYKDDFVILGILFDKETPMDEVKAFLENNKINFPITIGEENFKIAKVFGDIKMIPESFLYSKDGLFLEKFIGEVNERKLEDMIKANL